jgi:hypothetical protein
MHPVEGMAKGQLDGIAGGAIIGTKTHSRTRQERKMASNRTGALTGPGPHAVLFVGNSYTYCNDLALMVAALAGAAGGSLDVEQVIFGGWSLKRHWNKGPAREAVAKRRWDAVVLQDSSMQAIVQPWDLEKYGKKFDKLVRKAGAKTVFYSTWARQHLPKMQKDITGAYRSLARELGAFCAPAGEAWKRAFRRRPGLVLHTADRSHPTKRGSYLAACVFYATLTGRSPVGLPARLTVPDGRKRRTLISLRKADAAFFQQAAWDVIRKT